jgi:UDP-3-O-acyl-N-acetylglucosamine deacetylase
MTPQPIEKTEKPVLADHVAAISALRQTMTREQLVAAMHQADLDDFHAEEAANAPELPVLDAATWAALKAHLADGAGQPNPQEELIAMHVALAADDQRGMFLAMLAAIKSALRFVPQAAIDAALAAAQPAEPSAPEEVK